MSIKEQFPSLHNKDVVYLDTAATSQTPQCVIDAISKFYEEGYGNVGRSNHGLANNTGAVVNDARGHVQLLLHLVDERSFDDETFYHANENYEVVFTSGATESMNLLAHGLPLNKTDVVLLTELDHHATIVPWQQAAKQAGATLKYIPVKNGELDYKMAEELILQGCRVICLPHLSNVTGSVQDIKRISALAKKVGAIVFVDGAQAVAHLDINLEELDVHAYTFSAHKLYGPTGLGVLVVDGGIAEQLKPVMFGGEMITKVSKHESTWTKLPERLEAGTLPLAQIAGLTSAIKFFRANKEELRKEEALMQHLTDQLKQINGLQLHSCEDPVGCVSFSVDGCFPGDIGNFLALENVCVRVGHHCAQPLHDAIDTDRTIRVSVGIYNDKQDIDTFITLLKKIVEELKQ